MKNIKLFFLTCLSTLFLQENIGAHDYPFEVSISGEGIQHIVLIPGFGCSGTVWDETVLQYTKQFTCHTLTMAGFSGVEPKSDPSFQAWSDAVADYIAKENLNQPHLIGHSMGGAMVMNIAADYPDLISKIIVVDALPCLAALMNPSFEHEEQPDCSQISSQLLSLSNDQFKAMQHMNIPSLLANESKREQVVEWTLTSDRTTFAEMFCSFSNTDLREKISKITCPSLILLEAPFVHNKANMEAQYTTLKTADIRYAEKGLHFIMYDNPNWYFNQLDNFIFTK